MGIKFLLGRSSRETNLRAKEREREGQDMPPHKEPHRVVRTGQPNYAEFMEDSVSAELLETVQKVHDVKEQEDQLLSMIGSYESDIEVNVN